MGNPRKAHTSDRKPGARQFIVFSIILYVVILIVGSIAFVFSMQQTIKTNKSNELARLLETERIRLEASLNAEIAIVLKLANSPIIERYLIDPDDPELEKVALEEIASYRQAFTGYSIFWINDKDMVFYSDDNEPYFVDASDPVNYWYNMTLYETDMYNFNINYNPDIKQIKLWINAPVFDDDEKPVGMVGTGIGLNEFVDTVYENIDEGTGLYFFIGDGKIYGARDVGLIVDGANIEDVLPGIGIDILAEANILKPWEKQAFDIPDGIAAIGSIPLLDWYYIGTMSYSLADYDTSLTLLFFVMLLLILIIIIIFNFFVAGFLKSLRKAAESLSRVAQKREQELIADNEMLDRLNRMKNEFFRDMSHDFKTPLTVISTSILNAADMLDFGIDKDEMRESLGVAQHETMLMSRMVDSAMKYSSLHDNEQDMKPLNLSLLLGEGAGTYRALLERNGNKLLVDIPGPLPMVYGNADMLLHVLSNILSNSNRFTRDGEVTINAVAGNDTVTVTIRDTGVGIRPEILPYIFERGVSDSGTGLGLSICKTAIEAHGGSISAESTYGRGAVVSFTLPAYKGQDVEVHDDGE
ncbi:MAG: sensor histidine kinase [Clostridiales bacterium]|nr:sensor histidine kinase [Clostridiales bacterium]